MNLNIIFSPKKFMNLTQIKCLSVFAIFAIIGFGPISPGCLIGMYVVSMRPNWFWELTCNLYTGLPIRPAFSSVSAEQTKQARKKCFLSLLGLFIVDIAPIPVTPVVAFVIILSRPMWFYCMVATIYGKN
jgi:hypothetical protein